MFTRRLLPTGRKKAGDRYITAVGNVLKLDGMERTLLMKKKSFRVQSFKVTAGDDIYEGDKTGMIKTADILKKKLLYYIISTWLLLFDFYWFI